MNSGPGSLRELAESADLILCFEEEQRNNIVDMAPSVVRRTFLVTDFANMCLYCAQHDLVKGLTVQERLTSVIETSSFVRPMIPVPRDVEDPFTKDFLYSVKPRIRPIRRYGSYSTACASITE